MQSKSIILLSLAVLTAAVIVLTVFVSTGGNNSRIPYQNEQAVSDGKKLYETECASCHGVALEGQSNWKQRNAEGYLPAPPQDQTGHTWHHPDELLFRLTKQGIQAIAGPDYKSHMPAFESKLTDEQIWSVLAYIKSQWPQDLAERHSNLSDK